ncbi:unnamed protein product, partial [Pylaiella littoralis]
SFPRPRCCEGLPSKCDEARMVTLPDGDGRFRDPERRSREGEETKPSPVLEASAGPQAQQPPDNGYNDDEGVERVDKDDDFSQKPETAGRREALWDGKENQTPPVLVEEEVLGLLRRPPSWDGDSSGAHGARTVAVAVAAAAEGGDGGGARTQGSSPSSRESDAGGAR